MTTAAIRADGNDVLIRVRLSPRASRDAVLGEHGDSIKIAVTSPPVDDRANAHLVKFLAATLDVSRARVRLVDGEHSRNKTLRVEGIEIERVRRCLIDQNSSD